MTASQVEALVEELQALGIKFTVTPRMDGSLRLNKWRTQHSWPNRDRINKLLAEHVDYAPGTAAQMAELVSRRSVEAQANPIPR